MISDALLHLNSNIHNKLNEGDSELNALYVYFFTFIRIDKDFRAKIVQGYKKNTKLKNIIKVLKKNHGVSAAKFPFEEADNDLIFHINKLTDKRLLIIL